MEDSLDILIKKFIANNCSKEEAEYVIDKLLREPVLIEQYFSVNEWDDILANENIQLSTQSRKRIEKVVFEKVSYKKRITYYIQYAAAACILFLIIFSSSQFYFKDRESNKMGATTTLIKKPSVDTKKVYVNTSAYAKEIQLPDGSVVQLNSHSSITLKSSFLSKRDIFLNGNAYFIVAKDKNHPFTVYENGIAVTALGTEFWVRSDKSTVTVYLHEGKVVVKSTDADFHFKATTLLPGQDFSVNKEDRITILNLNKQLPNSVAVATAGFIKEKSSININGDTMEFYYTPIYKVLETLEDYFDVKIISEKKKSSAGNQFTGKVYLKDSVELILNKISEINDIDFHILFNKKIRQDSVNMHENIRTQVSVNLQKNISAELNSLPLSAKKASPHVFTDTYRFSPAINITNDYIAFEYVPLSLVFQTLADYYQTDIEYKGTSKNQFTGKAYHQASVEKFIKNICKINSLKYSKKENKIIIYE